MHYDVMSRQTQCTYRTPNGSFFFFSSLLHSSSTRRFYPQRSCGQAVVTGVVPLGTCLQFLSRIGFSIPTARRFSSNFCYLMLSRFPLIIFYARKSSCECVHSVRIELTKLILVGTRITYQATGEYMYHKNGEKTKQYSYTVQMLPLTEKLVQGKTLSVRALSPLHLVTAAAAVAEMPAAVATPFSRRSAPCR